MTSETDGIYPVNSAGYLELMSKGLNPGAVANGGFSVDVDVRFAEAMGIQARRRKDGSLDILGFNQVARPFEEVELTGLNREELKKRYYDSFTRTDNLSMTSSTMTNGNFEYTKIDNPTSTQRKKQKRESKKPIKTGQNYLKIGRR